MAAVPRKKSAAVYFVDDPDTYLSNRIHETTPSRSGTKRKLEGDDEDNTSRAKCANNQYLNFDETETPEDTSLYLHERTLLQYYIINNDIPMINSIIEKCPAVVNMNLPNSYTPLTLAISEYPKTKEAFNFLINFKSIDIHIRDRNCSTPLMEAIANDREDHNLEVIQYLLDKYSDIDRENRFLDPLTLAVGCRRPDVILLIMNAILKRKPVLMTTSFRKIFNQMLSGIDIKNIMKAKDTGFIQFDIANMYKIVTDLQKPTREQLIDIILNPIRQRRNMLTFAVEQKSHNFIKYLLTLDIIKDVINEPDEANDTALSLALRNKDLGLAQWLLEKGASLIGTRTNKNVLFNSIIKTNGIDAVKLLSEYNADVSTGGDHIPLTQAVKNNNQDLVDYLLDKGANIHGTCWKGYNALTAAIHYSNLPIAEFLINRGADVNLCDASGRSPLNVAIEENKQEFVAYLMEKNTSVIVADLCGFTPLTQAVKANRLNLIELLCDKGSDPNVEDENGHTPLTYAARLNHEEIVMYLINVRQVDVNKQGWFGSTALLNAINNNNIKLAQVLLSKGARVNAGNWKGRKPLVQAVKTNNIQMLQLLLEYNNDNKEETNISINWLQWKEAICYSPLSMAVVTNKHAIVEILLQDDSTSNRTKTDALVKAVQCKNIPIIELLLENGVNPIELDASGVSPLQRAIDKEDLELIELLAGHCDIDHADIFTEAFARNAFKILRRYFHNIKIDVNVIDSKGYTPLTRCVENGNLSAIKSLCIRNADVNRIDGNGFTPLTKALEMKNFNVVAYLVRKRADVSLADGNNVKPLAKAVEIDDILLVKFLINHDWRNEEPLLASAECPVCYLPLRQTEIYSTTCGHVFCKNCLISVCRSNNSNCPTCRGAISNNTIHPLFIS